MFKKNKVEEKPSRITNDTLSERREEVLAKGRKFKYPVQYLKHRLVINTIIISVVAIVVVVFFGWFQLYKAQNSGDIMYRVTTLLPVPVASVDDQDVLFSDYLMQYRSSLAVIEYQEGKLEDNEDNRRRLAYYKRAALDNSEMNAFAIKLAKEHDIKIDKDRIEQVFKEHRQAAGTEVSEESFVKIIKDNYGLSKSEYERLFIELPLIKQEVAKKIDLDASKTISDLQDKLSSNGSNFETVAESFGEKVVLESSGGAVSIYNMDGGRAAKAAALKKGQVSDPFISKPGDGYYIVKNIGTSEDDSKVEYLSIFVEFNELQKRFDALKGANSIREYIKIDQPE